MWKCEYFTHNCGVRIELHDDEESCVPRAGWHGDGDLVLGPGHVVLGVGAGPGASTPRNSRGHRGLRTSGRVGGTLGSEAIELPCRGVTIMGVGALVTAIKNETEVKQENLNSHAGR